MLTAVMGVVDMEVDKIADEVANMVSDKEVEKVVEEVADIVVKIPNEDFTDVTLAIGGTYGDDARGGGC